LAAGTLAAISLDFDDSAASAVSGSGRIRIVALFALFGLNDAIAAVGAESAVRIAPVVPAHVVRVAQVALLSRGQDAIATDRLAFAASRVEPGQGQLERRPLRFALGMEDLDLVDIARNESQIGSGRRAGVEGDFH